jgi:hypothetical protein
MNKRKVLSSVFSLIVGAGLIAAQAPTGMPTKNVGQPTKSAPGLISAEPTTTSATYGPKVSSFLQNFRTLNAKPATAASTSSKKANHAIALADEASDKLLYGGVVYADTWSSNNTPYGIYTTTTSSPLSVSSYYPSSVININGGGFYARGNYYFIYWEISSDADAVYTYIYTNDAYPFKYTGTSTSVGMDHIATDMTYDPIADKVYGAFSIGDLATEYYLGEMDLTTFEVKEITTLDQRFAGIAANSFGKLYGIGFDGNLYQFDKATGKQTLIGKTGVKKLGYQQSATFDENDVLYWTACFADGTSGLYTVNTETGAATKVGTFSDSEEFVGIYFPKIIADGAPTAVPELFPEFEDGSLSGTIAFDAPSTAMSGATLTGNLTYHLKVDNVEKYSGTVKVGKRNYEIPVEVPERGYYTFSLSTENAAGRSDETPLRIYIGNDNPVAPTNATATNVDRGQAITVTWKKPYTGVNGGYVDTLALTYDIVRFPDDVKVATGVTDTTYTDTVEREDLRCYYYTITPSANGLVGEPATTNKVVVGHIAQVPYVENFDTDVDFSTYTVIDANGDAGVLNYGTWNQSGYKGGVAQCSFSSSDGVGKDDWLITPPIHLRADMTYDLKFLAQAQGKQPYFPESMEVFMGDSATVSAMTTELIKNHTLTNEYLSYSNYSAVIHVDKEGEYYIGFHATTPTNSLMLNIDDVSVTAGSTVEGPAAVEGLTVTPGEKGALTAELKFTTPTKKINGDALDALSKVEISRDDELIYTFTAPAVGTELTYTDNAGHQGNNTYKVQTFSDVDQGLTAKETVYLGLDVPLAPQNVTLYEKSGALNVSWEAPSSVGKNGYYVDVDGLTYTVTRYVSSYNYTVVAKDIKDLHFSDTSYSSSSQAPVSYYVTASNAVGTSSSSYSNSVMYGGTNVEVPIRESFPDGYLGSNIGWYVNNSTTAYWGLTDSIATPDIVTPYDADGGMAAFGATEAGAEARIYTGKITLNNTINPMVSLQYYCLPTSSNVLKVQINETTLGWKDIKTVKINEGATEAGWVNLLVDLKPYINSDYIQFGLVGVGNDTTNIIVDRIIIDDMLTNNLELTSIDAPSVLSPGESGNIAVTVTNRGLTDAADYSVNIMRNGELFHTFNSVNITPSYSNTFELPIAATLGSDQSTSYYAEIAFAADMKASDNKSETLQVFVDLPRKAAASNLSAQVNGETVTLNWTKPDATTALPEPITDDIESYTPFIIDNIGNWTVYDGDQQYTWGISDGSGEYGSIIKYDNAGMPIAWQVFNPAEAGLSTTTDFWGAHSGSQMLISYAPLTGSSDDWLISEQLNTGVQLVKFYARSIVSDYTEYFEVLASSTDNKPESFTCLGKYSVINTWTKIANVLPEGTKYFAIRCTSPNCFALIIDDISYVPANAVADNSEVLGYNIYRDDEQLNVTPVTDLTYVDSNITRTDTYRYNVTAVYAGGESKYSNDATVSVTSGIESVDASAAPVVYVSNRQIVISGAAGKRYDIYTADGRTFRSATAAATEAVDATPGVYLVRVAAQTVKVIVK